MCEYSQEGICEIRCGIADDPSCDGSEQEMHQCCYIEVEKED